MMTEEDAIILELRNRQMQADRAYLTLKLAAWRANASLLFRLRKIGALPKFDCDHLLDRVSSYLHVEVDVADLPKLRAEFGKCLDTGCYEPYDEYADGDDVKVFLDIGLGPYPNMAYLQVFYRKTLPPDSPCRVVREMSNRRTVVCERNQ